MRRAATTTGPVGLALLLSCKAPAPPAASVAAAAADAWDWPAQAFSLASQLEASEAARKLLQQRLASQEAVIGELARCRDGDACDRRVSSWEWAAKEAQRATARALESLSKQHREYHQLQSNTLRTIAEMEEAEEDDTVSQAAALAVFRATATAAEARTDSAYWRAKAHDAGLEARYYRHEAEAADEEVARLRRCLDRTAAAAAAAEARAAEAEAALVLERQQAIKQASPILGGRIVHWGQGGHVW